jgi:ribose transport system ATP-binding protein
VVGLTGLIGSGYDEIVYMAFGAVPAAGGTLELGDRAIALAGLTPTDAIAAGCILIPGDRQEAGAVTTLGISDNLNLPVLGRVSNAWALAGSELAANAARLAERFDVRPRDPSLLFGALSGGNQQKALLAKWFQTSPRLVLLDEPTQGVDVGARAQVFSAIAKAAEDGERSKGWVPELSSLGF